MGPFLGALQVVHSTSCRPYLWQGREQVGGGGEGRRGWGGGGGGEERQWSRAQDRENLTHLSLDFIMMIDYCVYCECRRDVVARYHGIATTLGQPNHEMQYIVVPTSEHVLELEYILVPTYPHVPVMVH
jgi:hypothetical protein